MRYAEGLRAIIDRYISLFLQRRSLGEGIEGIAPPPRKSNKIGMCY